MFVYIHIYLSSLQITGKLPIYIKNNRPTNTSHKKCWWAINRKIFTHNQHTKPNRNYNYIFTIEKLYKNKNYRNNEQKEKNASDLTVTLMIPLVPVCAWMCLDALFATILWHLHVQTNKKEENEKRMDKNLINSPHHFYVFFWYCVWWRFSEELWLMISASFSMNVHDLSHNLHSLIIWLCACELSCSRRFIVSWYLELGYSNCKTW